MNDKDNLESVDDRYGLGVPVHVNLQSLQPRVHQENEQEERVNDREAAEELGEGGAHVVSGQYDNSDGVGDDTENTEADEEDSLTGTR